MTATSARASHRLEIHAPRLKPQEARELVRAAIRRLSALPLEEREGITATVGSGFLRLRPTELRVALAADRSGTGTRLRVEATAAAGFGRKRVARATAERLRAQLGASARPA